VAEKQYSIGEFAAINRVTPRMLRHYDKIGLLKPAAISENGYRVYTSVQIETVSGIRLYQSCGFTLTEIMKLLDAGEAEVQQAAKAKLKELYQNDKLQQLARGQLLTLSKEYPGSYTNHYDISYVRQSEQLLLYDPSPITESKIEFAIEQLYLALEARGVTPDGFCLLFSDLKTPDEYHVAVPVNTTHPWDGYEYRSLEAGWYLSTIHHGDYFSIGMAYDRLIRYAEENEHFLKPPFLECYLLDSDSVASKSQYLTQIFIGLTP